MNGLETIDFRTPQEVVPKKNVYIENTWHIGIDIGFGSVKGYAPNKYYCVPSYVKRVDGDMLKVLDEDDILLEDASGIYLVGKAAQEQVTADDTSDTDAELFRRNRYGSKTFEVLAMVGLGIGLMSNKIRQRPKDVPVVIQTGLPTAYMVKRDIHAITKVFQEEHDFRLRIGTGAWRDVHVKPQEVHVMPQPSGTMYAVIIDEEGHYIQNAKSMLLKNMMIVDVGYGTFDPYGTISRKVAVKESLPGLGMLRVLQEMAGLIYKEHGEDIRVSALPKYLSKGFVTVLDEEHMTTKDIAIGPYLEAANRAVCMDSIEKLKERSNYLRDYEVLVITGGTGAAWYDMYADYFKGMKGLQVIPGNCNDGLPMMYSNVRGYYMLRYMELKTSKRTIGGS